jgi:hypothetical protein
MAVDQKKLSVAAIIMAAVVAVLVITLLAVAIPKCGPLHHGDPDFLEVCWVDGEARYVDGAEVNDGACGSGSEELAWPREQIPLSVTTLSPEGQVLAEDSQGATIVTQILGDINTRVRFQLFSSGPANPADADAVVHWGEAYDIATEGADAIPGFVRHRRRAPGLLRADVYIRAVHSDELAYRIAFHELLHVPGLRHDDWPDSVMFPLTADSLMSDFQPVRITDSDVEALRSRYGPR